MVGQAYSLDFNLGYEYIVIRAYDCDDLSFVDSTTPYQVYRVERKNLKADLILPKSGKITKRLSLKHITKITEMITFSEDAFSYPVAVSWAVTPSGECVRKSAEDIYSAWPVPSWLIHEDVPYINISELCFKNPPPYLDASFLCEVLNEAAYLCGIYNSDMFVLCGNEIFCSMDFASLECKIFGSDTLYSGSLPYGSFKLPKCRASTDNIVSHIRSLKFNHGDYLHGNAGGIINIKRECIENICHHILECIHSAHSFKWLVKRVKLCVARSLSRLKDYGTELISNSASALSTDVNYLFYNELLEAFAFADSMRDTPKTIRKNRLRRRYLKDLKSPKLIYKGRLYR